MALKRSVRIYRSAGIVSKNVQSNYLYRYFALWCAVASVTNNRNSNDVHANANAAYSQGQGVSSKEVIVSATVAELDAIAAVRNKWLHLFDESDVSKIRPGAPDPSVRFNNKNSNNSLSYSHESAATGTMRRTSRREGVRRRVLDRLERAAPSFWDSEDENEEIVDDDFVGTVDDVVQQQSSRETEPVFVRHYLRRWLSCTLSRQTLKKRSAAVQRKCSARLARNFFRVLLTEWVRAVHQQYQCCADKLREIQCKEKEEKEKKEDKEIEGEKEEEFCMKDPAMLQ